ncbi:unnamed protein product [Adineta steineri]|uniref:Uncharacterized protein n=1 Tax=Adineta steineri TaxID=433720 RepID=A0A815ZQB1_9BILA|nr:unnamed protein product [Adineta steineri]CAF1586382.1 unnamed protein product [Adineta steineri]
MMTSFSDHSYELLVVGDKGVGKTVFSSVKSILHLGESPIEFCFGYNVRKKEINLNGERIELDIYDSSSAKSHRSFRNNLYRRVHGIFIIYDTTNKESFENLKIWLHEINNYANKHKHVMKLIIGNKCDLVGRKAVSFDEAREYGIQSNVSMFEVSAQNFTNVELAFQRMVLKIRSNSTLRSNYQPDQYGERIGLDVSCIFDVDSNVAEQDMNDQGLHNGTENENEQLSTESDENADGTHIQSVDEREMERAQILPSKNQTVEEKAKESNLINFAEALMRFRMQKNN